MGRRGPLPATRGTAKSGPVTGRSLCKPPDGWTLEQALALVAQGYTPAHVAQLTGWHARQLEARLRRRRHRGAA